METVQEHAAGNIDGHDGQARIVLKLTKPATKRHVVWREDTVDNEHLNRRKSKCCCVYVRPREFGESSSDSDDGECDHCRGHFERGGATKVAHSDGASTTDEELATTPESSSGGGSRSGRRVVWTADTIDNEDMNKRKSKCCCIYEKPREFGESSSDSDGSDCDNCMGHVEKRRRSRNAKPDSSSTSTPSLN